MRLAYLFFASITLLFALILLSVGVFFLALPSVGEIPQVAPEVARFIGAGLALLAIFLLIAFGKLNKRQHHIKGKGFSIDEQALKAGIQRLLSEFCKGHDLAVDVFIKKGRLHINAEFPSTPYSEQRKLLKRIETKLGTLLEDQFGYSEVFYFSAVFH